MVDLIRFVLVKKCEIKGGKLSYNKTLEIFEKLW